MRAAGRTQAGQINKPQNRSKWFRFMLLAGCAVACAGWIYSQSGQTAQSPASGQQHGSDPQAPSSQQQPMVMGESPDSQDNSGDPPAAAPTQPTGQSANPASAQAPNKPAAVQPAPWNPATQTPEDAGARSVPAAANQPAQPPAPTAVPASAPAPEPIVHVADAGGDQARQQINNECADLEKMANDLKAQMDKTTKDMLSIAVIRKANEIEQLAHRVRDEMRPEVGKN
jgi:hypothetical protein